MAAFPQLATDARVSSVFHVVNPVDLAFTTVPEREWIVPDWLPVGCVTALYGDGGVGKTLLAQQLMTATAIGRPWCGIEVMQCRSLGFFCEDDEAELHRRQAAICAANNATLADLESMRWISGVGEDNSLLSFDLDRARPTLRYEAIKAAGEAHRARLLVFDTAADLFSGNENDRHQVRRFIGQLNRLAIDLDAAVVLNAHPSRSGLASGNLDGGSTGWSNSVRSRWTLGRVLDENGQEEDTNARVLVKRKANYAGIGDTVPLRWHGGVLTHPQAAGGTGAAERAEAVMVFLELLDRSEAQGVYVSNSKNAGNFAPKMFSKRHDRKGYGAKDFDAAMSRLFEQRRLSVVSYDRQGHRRLVRSSDPV